MSAVLSLGRAILMLILGIMLIVMPKTTIGELFTNVVFIGLIIYTVLVVVGYLLNRKSTSLKNTLLITALNLIFISLIAADVDLVSSTALTAIGVWALVMCLSYGFSAYLMHKDGAKGWLGRAGWALMSLIFGATLIFSPQENADIMYVVAGIYFIILAINLTWEFLRELFATDADGKRLKSKVKIGLPGIITALMPMKMLNKINEMVAVSPEQGNVTFTKTGSERYDARLEVFVHLSKNTAYGFGHIDIAIDNSVFSYGCYDLKSNRVFGIVSDGIMFEVPSKEKYLRFCIHEEKKRMIGYKIVVTDQQIKAMHQKIAELRADCEPWFPDGVRDTSQTYDDFSSRMHALTGARFDRFTRGEFKTYYVMIANCARVAHEIVSSAGLEALSVNGIVTPGTFMSNLDKLFEQKNTVVIERNVYVV